MILDIHERPRIFKATETIELKDMGGVILGIDEQISFKTDSGKTNDIAKKKWGYYLTNSINVNLKKQGMRTALVLSKMSGVNRIFINLVEEEYTTDFFQYLNELNCTFICWLDEWCP